MSERYGSEYPQQHPFDRAEAGTGESREISFGELLRIPRRRWVAIVVPTIAALLVGLLVTIFNTPTYTATVRIELPTLDQNGEPTLLVHERLLLPQVNRAIDNAYPGVDVENLRVTSDEGEAPTLDLRVRAASEATVTEAVELAVTRVLERQAIAYELARTPLQNEIARLNDRVDGLQGMDEAIDAVLAELRGEDPIQASLLLQEKTRLLSLRYDIEDDRHDLETTLARLEALPAQQLGEVIVRENPPRPTPGVTLVAALMLGLAAGLLLAFCWEFWVRSGRPSFGESKREGGSASAVEN